MSTQESLTSIFIGAGDGQAPRFVPIEDSGQSVTTITTTTRLGRSADATYFIKPNGEGLEHRQLSLLQMCGVSVPSELLLSLDGSEFATSMAGQALNTIPNYSESGRDTLTKVGATLRHIHDVLNDGRATGNALAQTYGNTSHIVDCFFYKYLGEPSGVTPQTYREHKNSIIEHGQATPEPASLAHDLPPFIPSSEVFHPALQNLTDTANSIAVQLTEKLAPHVSRHAGGDSSDAALYLSIPDQALCYGDFKPENILVDENVDGDIVMIDPVLTRGALCFDLAKFTSRHLLDTLGTEPQLAAFFEGYGLTSTEELGAYGPLNFSDLVAMDMLNILRSYTKRYVAENSSYRLIQKLTTTDFCDSLNAILVGLSTGNSTHQLDNLLM